MTARCYGFTHTLVPLALSKLLHSTTERLLFLYRVFPVKKLGGSKVKAQEGVQEHGVPETEQKHGKQDGAHFEVWPVQLLLLPLLAPYFSYNSCSSHPA